MEEKSVLLTRFEIWWQEEAKYICPSGDYLAIKELCKIAWLNGAFVEKYDLTNKI